MNRLAYRKLVNKIMLTLTGVCTVLTVSVLFIVLGYLVINGATSIDWAFLTQLPKPTGETGGGMANAIVGSAIMVGIAALIGLPVGFLGGIYLSILCLIPDIMISGIKLQHLALVGPWIDAHFPRGILDGMGVTFYFGGTSLLIVVGVAMDTVNQIEAQLIMRHYEGFTPRSGRIRGRRSSF